MNTGREAKQVKAPVVKPVSKRKELREAQRAALGAYCRFDKDNSDLFGGDSYKRWTKLTATERDYLDTVLAYTTLTSLHSLEARLEEMREEVRAGAVSMKGVPVALTELKLLGKSIDALSQDVAFLADAAQDAGYGRGDEDDDGDGNEPQDDGEEDVDNEEEDEPPPPPPSDADDAQDGDGQNGDGQDDAQDGDGQDGDAELPSLDSLMGSAPPVVDAEVEEVEEVEQKKPEPKKRRR